MLSTMKITSPAQLVDIRTWAKDLGAATNAAAIDAAAKKVNIATGSTSPKQEKILALYEHFSE